MPGICFKITQGAGAGSRGRRARTRWTVSGRLLQPADGYVGDGYTSTLLLDMFEFFHDKKVKQWKHNTCHPKCLLYKLTTAIKQKCLEVQSQIHSVFWLSTSALDFLQERATMVSINRKVQHPGNRKVSTPRAHAHVSP